MSVFITIRAANEIPINILGAFKATFSGMSPKKEVIRCDGIVYVSDSVNFQDKIAILVSLLKDLLLNFYHLKALEFKEICKFELKKSDLFLNFVNFFDFS